ncbi:hypothetical protein [Methylobacterium planeticum]|uniref:hypothetical protein n=1 Tax=Methylobacterium planeticum TaxID=2615211 RepID=UPI001FEF5A9D|nr:hypothetical protein [Methylobacterium planeticum]
MQDIDARDIRDVAAAADVTRLGGAGEPVGREKLAGRVGVGHKFGTRDVAAEIGAQLAQGINGLIFIAPGRDHRVAEKVVPCCRIDAKADRVIEQREQTRAGEGCGGRTRAAEEAVSLGLSGQRLQVSQLEGSRRTNLTSNRELGRLALGEAGGCSSDERPERGTRQ